MRGPRGLPSCLQLLSSGPGPLVQARVVSKLFQQAGCTEVLGLMCGAKVLTRFPEVQCPCIFNKAGNGYGIEFGALGQPQPEL